MKAKVLPVFFSAQNEQEKEAFSIQLKTLITLYPEAEFLPSCPVEKCSDGAYDAVVFPQLIGAAFAHKKELKQINKPIVVLTSSFGTVEMWDWEIVAYLREELDLTVFSPYNIEMAKVVLRAIGMKKEMAQGTKFLMFQDTPGEGMQAGIFKRFYWWEKECVDRLKEAFGIEIIYYSYKKLNERAALIADELADQLWEERQVPYVDLSGEQIRAAVKLYLAMKEVMDEFGDIKGLGANCLNESFYAKSTPCLAWDWLFEYDKKMWVCEGDLVSLLSQYIMYHSCKVPTMTTNIYPFLLGMAALKHEKIDSFPEVEGDVSHYALGVHCGYFGLAPRSFCTQWTMGKKVLEIVDENAIVIDCRLKEGPITLAKIHANMKKITMIEAEIVSYVQYPGSDCRNGALIHYKNKSGHRVMEALSSHHAVIMQGEMVPYLQNVAKIFGFETVVL
ncbi:MAG: hypothetical protein FWE25_05100 [Lachnospiraceae bacterium]|nr:hypothetical protein [Lachnospiraceae bacterium]